MGTAALFTSGAMSAATFSVVVGSLLFLSPAKSGSTAVFSVKKATALQRFYKANVLPLPLLLINSFQASFRIIMRQRFVFD